MTRLRFVGNGRISAWPPPFSAQVSVETVEMIRSMSESKSALAPAPMPPGPAPIGTVEGDMPLVGAALNCCARTSPFAANLLLVAIVHEHGRARAGEAWLATVRGGHGFVDQALQADVVARHEVRNRRHQVGHVVRLRIDLAVAKLFARDFEHFVVDRRRSSGAARGSG